MMHYTAAYFKENLPEWKRKKDPPLSRIFYRKVSFYLAAFAANMGITANQVSYFSMYVALLACVMFLLGRKGALIGAVLTNVWLVLDCTDGNLARNVKKQPFGEFADSVSSYVLVGFLGTAIGYYVMSAGGFFVQPGNQWLLLIGALTSSSDTLMRLIYQKYKSTERGLADRGIVKINYDERVDPAKVNSLRVRLESDFGVGGILPLLVLLGVIFHFLDLVLLYMFAYYGGSCVVSSAMTIRKARQAENAPFRENP